MPKSEYFLELLIMFSLICSCSEPGILEGNYLSLSRNEIKIRSNEAEEAIIVSSNIEWYVSESMPEWISVRIARSGTSGCIYLSVQENDGKGMRDGYITLNYGSNYTTIRIIQEDRKILYFDSPKIQNVLSDKETITIQVVSNVGYCIRIDTDWIKSKNSTFANQYIHNQFISFDIDANTGSSERIGDIIIYNEFYNISDTLYVVQPGSNLQVDESLDGTWCMLQEAERGNVNIVIMGDGFVKESLKEGGEYNEKMKLAMECFFSLEPYATFRNYFNVYQVFVESKEAGVGNRYGKIVNNRLGSKYGDGTEISCNLELCLDYVANIESLPAEKPVMVIVVLNDTKYAGTTYMYASGDAVALCPMSNMDAPNDFEGLVHHEAGGHGFGFLTDEYVYYKNRIPEKEVKDMQEWQSNGYMMNLCFSDVPEESPWNDILETGLYPEAGLYEGGSLYQYGVWRSEDNSCMNNNVPYYNVQSRRIIINRIMQLSDISYTFEEFLDDDPYLAGRKGYIDANCNLSSPFFPLAPPVYSNSSFRK